MARPVEKTPEEFLLGMILSGQHNQQELVMAINGVYRNGARSRDEDVRRAYLAGYETGRIDEIRFLWEQGRLSRQIEEPSGDGNPGDSVDGNTEMLDGDSNVSGGGSDQS